MTANAVIPVLLRRALQLWPRRPSNALDVHRIRTKTEWDGPRKETRVPPAA